MENKKALLFLDSEWTGVTTNPNQPWEYGYILDVNGKISAQKSFYLHHTTEASEWVVKNTLYKKIFGKSTTSKMYQENNMCIPISMKSFLNHLLQDVSYYKNEGYKIFTVGAAVEGDLKYLLNQAIEHNVDLGIHWRPIDLSQIFLGYEWAKGNFIDTPVAVPKMLAHLGIESSGKRHGVDVDNQDLRRIYYALNPIPGN